MRPLKVAQMLCGVCMLYVMLAVLVGLALDRGRPSTRDCEWWAEQAIYAPECQEPPPSWFRRMVVTWPRVAVVVPALPLFLMKSAFTSSAVFFGIAIVLIPFLLPPAALVIWAGFAFWRKYSKGLAIGLTAALLCEIVYVGLFYQY